MIIKRNKYNILERCVYAYIFTDKYVYVGLTYNLYKRNSQHLKKHDSKIYKHIQETNSEYELIQLTEYIDIKECATMENFYINKYRKDGYFLLNSTKGGEVGSYIKIWTKEKCIDEINKYIIFKEFTKNSPSAYQSCRKNNWLNDICPYYKIKKEKRTKKETKYNSIIVFEKNQIIYKNNINDMSKTIIIDNDVHEDLKNFCKENNQKINEYVNTLIRERLLQKTKSKIPQTLINTEGEIFDTVICTSISSEYKNNMPKELTLIRNTQDGSGFIANYSQL